MKKRGNFLKKKASLETPSFLLVHCCASL